MKATYRYAIIRLNILKIVNGIVIGAAINPIFTMTTFTLSSISLNKILTPITANVLHSYYYFINKTYS